MGSFKGHVIPGSLFLAVGLWHIWSAAARFVSDPGSFRVRAWNQVGSGRMRHLELYVIAGGALVDMCIELLYSTHMQFLVGRERILNPAHMNDFEHGGMLLMFFLFGLAALISQTTRYLPLSHGALSLIASAAFSAEYLLFYFHSTTHRGLEGYYHLLLVIIVGFCVLTSVASSVFPSSFHVDLSSGIFITLQGLWFYQTAFTLYGPMMPQGCLLDDVKQDIRCRSHDSEVRGELLANIQLFSLVLLVFLYVIGSYGVTASWYGAPELKGLCDSDGRGECGEGGAGEERVLAV